MALFICSTTHSSSDNTSPAQTGFEFLSNSNLNQVVTYFLGLYTLCLDLGNGAQVVAFEFLVFVVFIFTFRR